MKQTMTLRVEIDVPVDTDPEQLRETVLSFGKSLGQQGVKVGPLARIQFIYTEEDLDG